MKILVTGAKGMLGTDLMHTLGTDHDVTGVDLDEVDITNRASIRERIKRDPPQLVVNAAAFTDVDGCESRSEEAFLVNAHGAENLAVAFQE